MTPEIVDSARSIAAAVPLPADEVQKRAIARAVWTDLLWLMPDRTVTVTVKGDDIAVELGPPARSTAH